VSVGVEMAAGKSPRRPHRISKVQTFRWKKFGPEKWAAGEKSEAECNQQQLISEQRLVRALPRRMQNGPSALTKHTRGGCFYLHAATLSHFATDARRTDPD
jgi:hypothetical protein